MYCTENAGPKLLENAVSTEFNLVNPNLQPRLAGFLKIAMICGAAKPKALGISDYTLAHPNGCRYLNQQTDLLLGFSKTSISTLQHNQHHAPPAIVVPYGVHFVSISGQLINFQPDRHRPHTGRLAVPKARWPDPSRPLANRRPRQHCLKLRITWPPRTTTMNQRALLPRQC